MEYLKYLIDHSILNEFLSYSLSFYAYASKTREIS